MWGSTGGEGSGTHLPWTEGQLYTAHLASKVIKKGYGLMAPYDFKSFFLESSYFIIITISLTIIILFSWAYSSEHTWFFFFPTQDLKI